MERYLVLDLETVPDETLVRASDGEPARPYAEQVRRLIEERLKRSGGRSDFLPLPYHRPVAACGLEVADRGGALEVTDLFCWSDRGGGPGSEAAFLSRTWQRLEGRTVVTFHGRGFDLPVLELRSLKLGVPAPRWFGGGRHGPKGHLDVLEMLSNGGAASSAPLDLYAKLVGLPGKEGVAGKDVHRLYASGGIDRIAAYCMTDVVQTYLLFLRFRLVEGALGPEAYARSAQSARARIPALFARLESGERALLDGFIDRCARFFEDEFAQLVTAPPAEGEAVHATAEVRAGLRKVL